jgi:hypothetical protein
MKSVKTPGFNAEMSLQLYSKYTAKNKAVIYDRNITPQQAVAHPDRGGAGGGGGIPPIPSYCYWQFYRNTTSIRISPGTICKIDRPYYQLICCSGFGRWQICRKTFLREYLQGDPIPYDCGPIAR